VAHRDGVRRGPDALCPRGRGISPRKLVAAIAEPRPYEIVLRTDRERGSLGARAATWHAPAVVEIERKFVLDSLPADIAGADGEQIDQGYLSSPPDADVEVRVRRRGDGYWLTFKTRGDLVREEIEIPIGRDVFERLWPLSAGRRITKRRIVRTLDDATVEIDVYGGELAGLVTAEVEFSSSDEALAFEPPPWLGRDVTDDLRYRNQLLIIHGIPADASSSGG
jgi:adenylate cyclase